MGAHWIIHSIYEKRREPLAFNSTLKSKYFHKWTWEGKESQCEKNSMSDSSDGRACKAHLEAVLLASMGKMKREWVPVLFRESQRSLRLQTKTSSLRFHSPGFSKRMLTCSWLENIFKECFSLCIVHHSNIGITWQLWEMYILRLWSQTN